MRANSIRYFILVVVGTITALPTAWYPLALRAAASRTEIPLAGKETSDYLSQNRNGQSLLEAVRAAGLTPANPTLQGEVKLTALGGMAQEELGWSVAISGDTAIVGVAPKASDDPATGAAYIFVRDGASWIQQAKLIAGGNNGGRRD